MMPDGMADATMVAFLAGLASGMALTAWAYRTRARREAADRARAARYARSDRN
jgi:cbb3-type cytochrome oxidase subunit 3